MFSPHNSNMTLNLIRKELLRVLMLLALCSTVYSQQPEASPEPSPSPTAEAPDRFMVSRA